MRLGWTAMDAMHAEFDFALRALAAAPREEQGAALAALEQHLRSHFGLEERLMQAAGLAGGCHKHEHDAVLAVVVEVRHRLGLGDHEVVERLAAELPAWFDAHVEGMDGPLAAALHTATHETAESLARYAIGCVGAARPAAPPS